MHCEAAVEGMKQAVTTPQLIKRGDANMLPRGEVCLRFLILDKATRRYGVGIVARNGWKHLAQVDVNPSGSSMTSSSSA